MHEILVKHRVRIEEAKAASLLLLESPPRYKTEHVKAFLACVYRGREPNQPAANSGTQEPIDCSQCHGFGIATVLHTQTDLWQVDEYGYKRWKNPKQLYTLAVRCICGNGARVNTQLGLAEYDRSFSNWREEWDAANAERVKLGLPKVLRW